MKKQPIVTPGNAVALILIMAALYVCSLYNYLLFHSLVELFSIIVAFCIFMLAWNSREILKSNYLLFLGISYLFVGFLDLVHTLSYKGMGIFPGAGANVPTQLWIGARYAESLSLLAAPFFIDRKARPMPLLAVYAAGSAMFLWMIVNGTFPDCYVEGAGLTPFKKNSEYLISAILLAAFVMLNSKRRRFDPAIFQLISTSIFFTIGAEVAFTLYVNVYGISNLIGHFFKFISFYLIYKALIETGLRKPYEFLMRDLKKSEERLRESEREFRSMFELSAVGMAQVDPATYRFIRVNPKFCRITGFSPEELFDLTFSDITHPDDRYADEEKYRDVLDRTTDTWSSEKRYLLKAGGTIWVKVTGTVVFDQEDRPAYSVAIIEDITSRKKAEQDLRESEEKFRLISDAIKDVVWMSTPDFGKIEYVNPAYEKIWGRTRESLYRSPWSFADAVHPEDRGILEEWLGEWAGEKWQFNYRIIHPDGSTRWIEDSGSSVLDDGGAVRLLVGVARDITDRKKEETARENSLMRLNTLLNVSTSVLAAKTMEGMLQKVVDAAIALTGAKSGTSGHGYREGFFQVGATSRSENAAPCPPGNVFAVGKGGVYLELIETRSSLRLTADALSRHPRWRGLPVGHAPLRGLLGASLVGRDGNPRGLIMVTDKISGEFTEEDELLLNQLASLASLGLQHTEAREEVEQRAREAEEGRRQLGQLARELERSNEDLEQFAYIASHDLQEPLRMVSSFVQLLGRRYKGKLDEKADTYITYAVEGTTRMQRLLNDLLHFSRAGIRKGPCQLLDLRSALDQATMNLKMTIERNDAVLKRGVLPTVYADEGQMVQLFQNLIANAAKFRGEERPRIDISSQDTEKEWIIRVRDNGIGIDPRYSERIFLVFSRLHRREEYEGTGVGLAICKKIVERHGGRIWVESAPGNGSSFYFSLPKERENT